MCLTVYVAAHVRPPLVAWDDAQSAFHVAALKPSDDRVRRTISAPFVVFAGAHTKCGCGFAAEGDSDAAEAVESRRQLRAYVTDLLQRSEVELFVCWNGEPPEAWSVPLVMQVHDLTAREDWLVDNTRIVLRG